MARLTIKSLDDVLEDIRGQLQDSTITEIYELTYFVNTTEYTLPGYKSSDPRVLSIVGIEGPGYDGDYATENNLVDPTDYSLWNDYGSIVRVERGYGAASDKQVYTGLTISSLTFQDNSSVFITYTWQNPDFRPILTNFAGTSQLRMILSANSTVLQQYLVPIADTVNSFGIEASGDDLKRLLRFVGGIETPAISTTGKVEITNNSGVPFVIDSTIRFAAISSGSFILFQSVTGSGTIADGSTTSHDVIAVEAGTVGNVGSYSITKIYSSDTLATELTTVTLLVTNPPVIVVGLEETLNYFDNGLDAETDPEIRRKINLAFKSLNTSSYSTIEQAVLDVGTVEDVIVYDGENRKAVATDTFEVYVAPTSDIPLSGAAISQIKAAIDAVKPVGIRSFVNQVPHTFLTFDMTIYTDIATLTDTTSLAASLQATMSGYINARQIGEDVVPSTMLSLAKATAAVKDVEMTEVTLTELTSEVNATDSEATITNAAEDEVSEIFVLFTFNSVQKAINHTDDANAYYTITEDKVDIRRPPRVSRAVLGHDNLWRNDPREIKDYFTTMTGDQQINYDITISGFEINDGQELLVDYNYYDNLILDGVRIWLRATEDDQVKVEMYSVQAGDPPYGTGWTGPIANATATITLTGDGVARLYEFPFSTQPAVFDPDLDYYIKIEFVTSVGDITIPLNSYTGNRVLLYGDGDIESSPGIPNAAVTRFFLQAIYETYTKFTGVNSYQKIIIPSASFEPEKPRFRSLTLTFTAFEEE